MNDMQIPWQQLKFDENGLIPAIIQDTHTKKVLMLAYMNETSLQKTVESGETWFWSRSRKQLWNKGETSGNKQRVKAISYDCDGDTLLLQVDQFGPACHTGANTCFFQSIKQTESTMSQNEKIINLSTGEVSPSLSVIKELETLIATRKTEMPVGAYTTYLFQQGLDKILKKVGEEASEVIIAAKNNSSGELTSETADLIYHLLVMLQEQNVPLDEVLLELQKRNK